jgi:hypothetical protein
MIFEGYQFPYAMKRMATGSNGLARGWHAGGASLWARCHHLSSGCSFACAGIVSVKFDALEGS